MPTVNSPGTNFRNAVASERPLQLPGVINAYAALLARRAGFRAIYLSGSGVATASYGLPDLGITGLEDVLADVRRITGAVDLPLMVDADTGFGSAFNIGRMVREMIRSGAAGVHIEDQVQAKRCGHRPGKQIVTVDEMCDRIRAAVDARHESGFVIMARTDAIALEGMERAAERAAAYVAAGADMLFAEAVTELAQYQRFKAAAGVPLLANITEFGKTPTWTTGELAGAGVDIALYPLTAFRMMSASATKAYSVLRTEGTQRTLIGRMQTREELYDVIGYHAYEKKLDTLFGNGEEQGR